MKRISRASALGVLLSAYSLLSALALFRLELSLLLSDGAVDFDAYEFVAETPPVILSGGHLLIALLGVALILYGEKRKEENDGKYSGH